MSRFRFKPVLWPEDGEVGSPYGPSKLHSEAGYTRITDPDYPRLNEIFQDKHGNLFMHKSNEITGFHEYVRIDSNKAIDLLKEKRSSFGEVEEYISEISSSDIDERIQVRSLQVGPYLLNDGDVLYPKFLFSKTVLATYRSKNILESELYSDEELSIDLKWEAPIGNDDYIIDTIPFRNKNGFFVDVFYINQTENTVYDALYKLDITTNKFEYTNVNRKIYTIADDNTFSVQDAVSCAIKLDDRGNAAIILFSYYSKNFYAISVKDVCGEIETDIIVSKKQQVNVLGCLNPPDGIELQKALQSANKNGFAHFSICTYENINYTSASIPLIITIRYTLADGYYLYELGQELPVYFRRGKPCVANAYANDQSMVIETDGEGKEVSVVIGNTAANTRAISLGEIPSSEFYLRLKEKDKHCVFLKANMSPNCRNGYLVAPDNTQQIRVMDLYIISPTTKKVFVVSFALDEKNKVYAGSISKNFHVYTIGRNSEYEKIYLGNNTHLPGYMFFYGVDDGECSFITKEFPYSSVVSSIFAENIFASTLDVAGDVVIEGDISIAGDTNIKGNLDVTKNLNVKEKATIEKGLDVKSGGAEIKGDVDVKKEAGKADSGNLNVDGKLNVKEGANISGDVNIVKNDETDENGDLNVEGTAKLGDLDYAVMFKDMKESNRLALRYIPLGSPNQYRTKGKTNYAFTVLDDSSYSFSPGTKCLVLLTSFAVNYNKTKPFNREIRYKLESRLSPYIDATIKFRFRCEAAGDEEVCPLENFDIVFEQLNLVHNSSANTNVHDLLNKMCIIRRRHSPTVLEYDDDKGTHFPDRNNALESDADRIEVWLDISAPEDKDICNYFHFTCIDYVGYDLKPALYGKEVFTLRNQSTPIYSWIYYVDADGNNQPNTSTKIATFGSLAEYVHVIYNGIPTGSKNNPIFIDKYGKPTAVDVSKVGTDIANTYGRSGYSLPRIGVQSGNPNLNKISDYIDFDDNNTIVFYPIASINMINDDTNKTISGYGRVSILLSIKNANSEFEHIVMLRVGTSEPSQTFAEGKLMKWDTMVDAAAKENNAKLFSDNLMNTISASATFMPYPGSSHTSQAFRVKFHIQRVEDVLTIVVEENPHQGNLCEISLLKWSASHDRYKPYFYSGYEEDKYKGEGLVNEEFTMCGSYWPKGQSDHRPFAAYYTPWGIGGSWMNTGDYTIHTGTSSTSILSISGSYRNPFVEFMAPIFQADIDEKSTSVGDSITPIYIDKGIIKQCKNSIPDGYSLSVGKYVADENTISLL